MGVKKASITPPSRHTQPCKMCIRDRELQELHSPVYVCALCPGPVDTEFNDRAGVCLLYTSRCV